MKLLATSEHGTPSRAIMNNSRKKLIAPQTQKQKRTVTKFYSYVVYMRILRQNSLDHSKWTQKIAVLMFSFRLLALYRTVFS